MSFLILMSVMAALSYIPQWIWGPRTDWRMALRHGMAGGFMYTGIDHFIQADTRYQPWFQIIWNPMISALSISVVA